MRFSAKTVCIVSKLEFLAFFHELSSVVSACVCVGGCCLVTSRKCDQSYYKTKLHNVESGGKIDYLLVTIYGRKKVDPSRLRYNSDQTKSSGGGIIITSCDVAFSFSCMVLTAISSGNDRMPPTNALSCVWYSIELLNTNSSGNV